MYVTIVYRLGFRIAERTDPAVPPPTYFHETSGFCTGSVLPASGYRLRNAIVSHRTYFAEYKTITRIEKILTTYKWIQWMNFFELGPYSQLLKIILM